MDTQLIVRLIVSVIAVINSICSMAGFPLLNLGEEQVSDVVSAVLLVAAWAWGFWKNNSFTIAAKEGQKVTDAIKSGSIDASKVEELVK